MKEQTCNSFETHVEWYDNWTQLVCSKAILKHVLLTKDYCDYVFRGYHYWPQSLNSGTLKSAEIHNLKEMQRSEISEVSECLIRKKPILNGSSIISTAPFLDSDGLLRVIRRISAVQKLVGLHVHPIILSNKFHIATLLTRHFHKKVSIQGTRLQRARLGHQNF